MKSGDLLRPVPRISLRCIQATVLHALERTGSPEAFNALVERYFSAFLDRIHEMGGDINETAGDGFMAIFQETDRHVHATKAVDTALALLNATETLNQENSECPFAIHMGLNSGVALVGATRFEGLRGIRWTFTASGPVTNLAARLAGVAEAGQILVGPETVRRLGNYYRLEKLGQTRLKNVAEAIEIHRVLGRSSQPECSSFPYRQLRLGA